MAIEKLHIDFFLNKLVKVLLFSQVEPMTGYFIKSKTDKNMYSIEAITKFDFGPENFLINRIQYISLLDSEQVFRIKGKYCIELKESKITRKMKILKFEKLWNRNADKKTEENLMLDLISSHFVIAIEQTPFSKDDEYFMTIFDDSYEFVACTKKGKVLTTLKYNYILRFNSLNFQIGRPKNITQIVLDLLKK